MSHGRAKGLPPLHPKDLRRGQTLVRRFAALNGISVALLMESMLILYAIQNGVGDSAVAVLASFIHLTMPFVLLGKRMVARVGAAKTWGMGWFLRSLSAGLLVFAPFFGSEELQVFRTGLILVGGFGFAAFRAVGIVGNSPLIGEITDPGSRGRFLSGNFARTTSAQLVTLVAVIVILGRDPEIWAYQAVIGFGAVLGVYTGLILSSVPESEAPRRSAQIPTKTIMGEVWKNLRMRKLLFAWAAGFAAFTLVIPFAIITTKNGYGVSDQDALVFSLIALGGGAVSGIVNGIISDRVGPRPLLVLYVSLLGFVALFWSLAPSRLLFVPTALSFFVAGYCKFGILTVNSHYFLDIARETDRVGSAMVLRATSGAIAGLVGSVIGGGVLAILNEFGYRGLHVYRLYFRIALLAFLIIIPVTYALDRLHEWPLRKTALLHFRPRRILGMRRDQQDGAERRE